MSLELERLSNRQWQRLHDEALQQAPQLRQQAIDEFWRGLNAALWGSLSAVQRAATRLSHRLQQHQQQRQRGPHAAG